ncbi:MAG: DNA circularization N-terminal domain-containing protein [Myxococcota bacterium]|nr:DNA circularization N-terminal domain-containing protein [Myxococcota bacterium]
MYFETSYGGIPLLVGEISATRGRDIVVQSPSRGDKHTLSDRGKKLLIVSCKIKFLDQPGLADYLERYDAFIALAERPETQIFVDPIHGSYPARVGDLESSADGGELAMLVSCTIYSDDEPDQVFPVGAGVAPTAGLEEVATAAAGATDSLDELELESDVPTLMVDTVTAWSEATDLDSNEVFLALASLTSQIDEAIDILDLATDLSRWQAYEQMILLRYSLVRAASAFTADSATFVDVYVDQPRPLLAICAELFGAADAQDRADEAARSNRLRTPGLVPRGTTLKLPRPRVA